MQRAVLLALHLALLAALAGCGNDALPAGCTPGARSVCICAGASSGRVGVQECQADGRAYGQCIGCEVTVSPDLAMDPPDLSAVVPDGGIDGGIDDMATVEPAGDMTPVYLGGTLAIANCGYSINTRVGAEAPMPGAKMLGDDPRPWAIHLGLVGDPSTSMVVQWRTRDETSTATTVQYGIGNTGQSADGITFSFIAGDGSTVRLHQVHLCGLTPSTTYQYRVGGKDIDGAELWSANYQFHTAPARDSQSEVVIMVVGDTRGDYPRWGNILAKAQSIAAPDLILFSGDAVLLGTQQFEWDDWFAQAEPVLRTTPIVSAIGNHEVGSVNYYSQIALPGDQDYFSLDYGPVHLVSLNDSPANGADLQGKAATFLEDDLKAFEARPWKMLIHHRPMFSSSAHSSDLYLRSLWQPPVDRHHVDFVLNGHDHDYERSKPMFGNNVAASPANGTVYVVAGGGGAPLYGNGNSNFTAYSNAIHGFVLLRVRAGHVALDAYDDLGNPLDSLTYSK